MSLIANGYGTGLNEVHATTEFDAYPLIPKEVSREVMSGITEGSAALSMFRRLPNMSSRTYRMPVLSSLGNADFTGSTVSDDLVAGADSQINDLAMLQMQGLPYGVGNPGSMPQEGIPNLKKTHQMMWENVHIVAETMSIILPVPDDVIADSEYDLWAEMRPRIIEAFDKRIDESILWGHRRPTTWPSGIVPTAISRGQAVVEGTGADLGIDISNLMGILEQQAYDPNGFMASPSVKASLRNLRDSNGQPIFTQGNLQGGTPDSVYGLPIAYIKNNSFQPNIARMICGKTDEAVFSIREDMRFQIFTEGVISDENGRVIMNLMQNDMKAMRVVMRLGWALPNPIHQLREDRAGYPFAVLRA
jgi:HK97 family phage major capsid protein